MSCNWLFMVGSILISPNEVTKLLKTGVRNRDWWLSSISTKRSIDCLLTTCSIALNALGNSDVHNMYSQCMHGLLVQESKRCIWNLMNISYPGTENMVYFEELLHWRICRSFWNTPCELTQINRINFDWIVDLGHEPLFQNLMKSCVASFFLMPGNYLGLNLLKKIDDVVIFCYIYITCN